LASSNYAFDRSRGATPWHLAAQGIATGAVRGTLRTPDGAPVDSAMVSVVNQATGYAGHTVVRADISAFQSKSVGRTQSTSGGSASLHSDDWEHRRDS
jgi:hypothetical protein